MNYELLKRRMAKFFSETSAEVLVAKLEVMGNEFYQSAPLIDFCGNVLNNYGDYMAVTATPYQNSWLIPPQEKKKKSKKDLENSRGLFFFVKLRYDTIASSGI